MSVGHDWFGIVVARSHVALDHGEGGVVDVHFAVQVHRGGQDGGGAHRFREFVDFRVAF